MIAVCRKSVQAWNARPCVKAVGTDSAAQSSSPMMP